MNAQNELYVPVDNGEVEFPIGVDGFWAEVYTEFLMALEEDNIETLKTKKEIYRFLWLRTFHNPIVFARVRFVPRCTPDSHLPGFSYLLDRTLLVPRSMLFSRDVRYDRQPEQFLCPNPRHMPQKNHRHNPSQILTKPLRNFSSMKDHSHHGHA